MGLLKRAIGSAIGAGQPNNGLGGPSMPWKTRRPTAYGQQNIYPSNGYQQPNYNSQPYSIQSYNAQTYYDQAYLTRSRDYPVDTYQQYSNNSVDLEPPQYDESSQPRSSFATLNRQSNPTGLFQPLGLPQISHGDGHPFFRGYSSQLAQHGITDRDFIQIVDAINVAIIPDPENQIFQKGANIAGWFVLGAAGIGLMAGQAAVGLGASFGHSSIVSRTLSKANMELFLPVGLEMSVVSSKNVNDMFNMASSSNMARQMPADATPEQQLAYYRGLLAPLSVSLPPLARSGRNDHIVMIGKRFGDKKAQKSIEKARESAQKGKYKDEVDVKWLVVRCATPEALAFWRRQAQESNGSERSNEDTSASSRVPRDSDSTSASAMEQR